MHVGLRDVGQVEVDDQRQFVDVNAACGDVGRNQYGDLVVLELFERVLTGVLRLVAVDGLGRDACAGQVTRDTVGTVLGAGEDQRLGQRALFEHSAQQVTLGLFVGEVYALLDQLDRGCRRNDGYMARLVQHVVGQIGNLLGHGSREEQGLTLLGQELQNALDIVDKAHVQHAVGLVQNKALNRADVDQLLTHQIPQTARGCDQNVGAVLDGFDLRILGHTAKDDRRNTAEIAAILAQILVNL